MDSCARAALTVSGETGVHEECGGNPCEFDTIKHMERKKGKGFTILTEEKGEDFHSMQLPWQDLPVYLMPTL
jgi:hypothetical protein